MTFAFAPWMARWWHARSQPAKSAPPAATGSRAAEIADAPGKSMPGPEPAQKPASETSPAAAQVKAQEAVVPEEGCDMGLLRTAPWRLSPAACARRFEADPSNAALALAVAQAEHAHARLNEAARWARRALALDPKAAEAYVLVARADAENGRPEDAREAYRNYLELAPRGWHQAEARAAVRRARTAAPVDSAHDR
jgi:tetratricopeptide (TPR) repeat protein